MVSLRGLPEESEPEESEDPGGELSGEPIEVGALSPRSLSDKLGRPTELFLLDGTSGEESLLDFLDFFFLATGASASERMRWLAMRRSS